MRDTYAGADFKIYDREHIAIQEKSDSMNIEELNNDYGSSDEDI